MTDLTELSLLSNLKKLTMFVDQPSSLRRAYQVVTSIIREAPYLEFIELMVSTFAFHQTYFQTYWENMKFIVY